MHSSPMIEQALTNRIDACLQLPAPKNQRSARP